MGMGTTVLNLRDFLRKMEWAMSFAEFTKDWPLPFYEDGIFYISPANYRYGFGSAITPEGADYTHRHIRDCGMAIVKGIPWC